MASGGLAAQARAESVARASYGRLVAVLAAANGDIPMAEDALSDAFVTALSTWPTVGIPDNPEGWLITVARNRQRDVWKSAAHLNLTPLDDATPTESTMDELDLDAIPDKRLALMFVCAHPAIDASARTPLMLQTVLGFESAQIATAFALPHAAMAQRLVRAKRRIKDARIRFAVPERDEMPSRLPAVLEAIYGTYSINWLVDSGSDTRDSLAGEALYLAVTLASLLGDEPEAFGLAALICLSMARTAARTSPEGLLIPLGEQDPSLWNTALIAEGESYLQRAHDLGRIGRFQLEAAIQSAHCARATTGVTDWTALRTLYEGLVRLAPTLGALVSLASTIAETTGAASGLAFLDGIDEPAIGRFQPAWATRAHLLVELGRIADAAVAYDAAISLTTDAPSRQLLEARAAALWS